MQSTLFDNAENTTSENEHFVQQNKNTLLVNLNGEVYAKKGSMIAYQGNMDFEFHGGGAGKMLKKVVTGENLRLMKAKGTGDLFLADSGAEVHILYLNNEELTVNSTNLLAFESSLAWDVKRIKAGVAGLAAGGLFNVTVKGTGYAAITSWGVPVTINVDKPTMVDVQCALAWSTSLDVSVNSTFKASSLIGRGSGEAFQMAFNGRGFVVVQPGEGLGPLIAGAAAG